jgi:hypothetical protein
MIIVTYCLVGMMIVIGTGADMIETATTRVEIGTGIQIGIKSAITAVAMTIEIGGEAAIAETAMRIGTGNYYSAHRTLSV